MKYRIDAYYKSGAVKQGTKLLDNIDRTRYGRHRVDLTGVRLFNAHIY